MNAKVKPRYDNKGTEFGKIHRMLPEKNCMFDIDKMQGQAIVNLEMTKQDIGFIEYKTDFNNCDIKINALFEIKYKNSKYVQEAMKCKIGTSTFAQLKVAEKLECRYFFIIATNGKQPFYFYEYKKSKFEYVGKLEYDNECTQGKITIFWKNVLKLL